MLLCGHQKTPTQLSLAACCCCCCCCSLMQNTFCTAFRRSSPDFQTRFGYEVDAPNQANMAICSNQVGGQEKLHCILGHFCRADSDWHAQDARCCKTAQCMETQARTFQLSCPPPLLAETGQGTPQASQVYPVIQDTLSHV